MACSKSPVLNSGEEASHGDCYGIKYAGLTEGRVIDNYSVAIHWMSVCTLFAVIDTAQQETANTTWRKVVKALLI